MKRKMIWLFAVILATAGFERNAAAGIAIGERPNEVIFVQTDRDIYIAGEHLFFSVELVKCPERDEPLSEIAYLALRNQFGIVESISLNLDQNRFTGSLYLPDTLSTGYLELIGFTNWMRNYDESCFFKKTILVVNRFDNELTILNENLRAEDQAELAFFPEGGHLVAGMEQKLMLTTSQGHRLPFARINIFSDGGDTLKSVTLNEMGWTTFDFVPMKGQRYFALINERDRRFFLPEPDPSGKMLRINQVNESMQVSMATGSPSEQNLNLVIFKNGGVIQQYPVIISNTEPVIKDIPVVGLEQGLQVFRLMDEEGNVMAERDWYVESRPVTNARVSLNKPAFGTRENLELLIQLEDPEDAIEWATVSVSQPSGRMPQNIHYPLFLMATDLIQAKGLFPNEVLTYLGNLGEENINDLLIKPLSSEENSAGNPELPFRYHMETSHLTLTGRITQAGIRTPASGARIILNAPDSLVNLLYAYANEEGLFTFFLDSYYDDREIFLTPDPGTISGTVVIEVFDKFDYKTPFSPEPFYFPLSYREAIKESQEIVEINKVFGVSAQSETTESTHRAEPVRVFSKPVYTIDTDDFIPLDDLQEIAREIIGPWRIRRTRAGTTHSLISQSTSLAIEGSPVLFVDGIITFDIEPLLHLNSRQIQNIQIQNLEWKHGDMHFPGIVALFTKNEEFRNLKLQPSNTSFFNTAHQFPARFVSPDYSDNATQKSQPDLRQLLFWYSGKPLNDNGRSAFSWFTSDILMDYTISIEGITRKGNLIKLNIPLPYER